MKLWKTPQPPEGTIRYRLCKFFVDRINFCEGFYYGTEDPKPNNAVYEWFYNHWLFPFEQNECICCNTVRGIIYGAIIGFLVGVMI